VINILRLAGWLLIAGLLASCSHNDSGPNDIVKFGKGAFVVKNQAQPPQGNSLKWQPVTLPDLWDYTHPQASGAGWYRFQLELDSPPH